MAQQADLAARTGANLEVVGVAVRSLDEPQVQALKPPNPTTDARALIAQADIVVELMGGIEPARTFILEAIRQGASVVTANKALLAAHGPALYEAAAQAGVDLFYEAAVGGAIPIVRSVRVSLAGDTITRILGIVNGTTNYVLDQMTREHLDFDEAVRQAQRLGYAEADPTADVEGFDAASKAAILASLAFHTRVGIDDVAREGITGITQADIAAAKAGGYAVKLLAIVERSTDDGGAPRGVVARVHPALVPLDHPLASVHGAFNAVFTESEAAGPLMFYGQGAGGVPTSSAVLGDVVTAARHRVAGQIGPGESAYTGLRPLEIGLARTRYQVRLVVADRPGVLASVARVFAAHDVSIEQVRQTPLPPAASASPPDADDGAPSGPPPSTDPAPAPGGPARANLIIVTHAAREADLAATVAELGALDAVDSLAGLIRVEGV
jgi:homoserine dehydrogenase